MRLRHTNRQFVESLTRIACNLFGGVWLDFNAVGAVDFTSNYFDFLFDRFVHIIQETEYIRLVIKLV